MIELRKSAKRRLALPESMSAPRNHDVIFFGEGLHNQAGRKVASVREVSDSKIQRSVAERNIGHCE
jgi:hypothetical protein